MSLFVFGNFAEGGWDSNIILDLDKIVMLYTSLINFIPFLLNLFYLFIFGDGTVSLFYIEYVVSNTSLASAIAIIISPFLADVNHNYQTTFMAMLNSILAILFWNVTMIVSPHALRYIDPSWDKESRNGKLYPALFYILRMAKRKNND